MSAITAKSACTILVLTLLLPSSAWSSDLLKKGMNMLSTGKSGISTPSAGSSLTQGEMGDGLKEALRVGTGNVVSSWEQRTGSISTRTSTFPCPENWARCRRR